MEDKIKHLLFIKKKIADLDSIRESSVNTLKYIFNQEYMREYVEHPKDKTYANDLSITKRTVDKLDDHRGKPKKRTELFRDAVRDFSHDIHNELRRLGYSGATS